MDEDLFEAMQSRKKQLLTHSAIQKVLAKVRALIFIEKSGKIIDFCVNILYNLYEYT